MLLARLQPLSAVFDPLDMGRLALQTLIIAFQTGEQAILDRSNIASMFQDAQDDHAISRGGVD